MALEPELDFVLITGAGASTALGAGGTRLPMMTEWCAALVDKLARGGSGYLGATGLWGGMEPMQFEEQLGRFLRQVTAFAQVQPVVSASKSFPAVSDPAAANLATSSALDSWHVNTTHHLAQVVEAIHISLYEQFAEPHFDSVRARDSYGALLRALGINESSRWVYVTTNYDTIGEEALRLLGFLPDWGEPPAATNSEHAVQVERLLNGIGRYTPVLHIHGRVGWYRRMEPSGGSRVYSATVTRHQSGFGVPVVMLPDPDKAYDSDPVINSLWTQFLDAVSRAHRVLVLGHSLNDVALAEAIRERVQPDRLGITVLGRRDDASKPDDAATPLLDRIRLDFPRAGVIPIRFGEEDVDATAIHTWLERSK